MQKNHKLQLKYFFIFVFFNINIQLGHGQNNFLSKDPFQTHFFIENKDSQLLENQELVLFTFTEHGQIIKILKTGFTWETYSRDSQESNRTSRYKKIQFAHTFFGENSKINIEYHEKSSHYFTDGNPNLRSYGFKKIIFKNYYPNIDLIYELGKKDQGFKYSFLIHQGGDFEKIKFQITSQGKLKIENHLDSLNIDCDGHLFTENKLIVIDQFKNKVNTEFVSTNNYFQFNVPQKYRYKALLIDPWVNKVTHLLRANTYSMNYGENIGYEVDYDSKGGVYIYGGCPITIANSPQLAKYSKTGNLLWTFKGKLTIPSMIWQTNLFAEVLGSFAMDHEKDKIYMATFWGNVNYGTIAVRLNENGDYDSFYINNPRFTMSAKLLYRCDPNRMISFGGFNNSYNNKYNWSQLMELVDTNLYKPKAFTINRHITNPSITSHTDAVFDAVTDDSNVVYVAYYSNTLNYAFKPYVFAKLIDSLNGNHWLDSNSPTLIQPKRFKPIVIPPFANPNDAIGASMNSLAVNKNYLFFYDGHYLITRNKTNGKQIFIDSFNGERPAAQQGIVVDNCNNIFLGCDSGRIKIYNFTGSSYKFLKSVTVFPNTAGCILDLAYDKNRNLLIFTGDSMVGTTLNPINCENSKETEFDVFPTNRCSDRAFAKIQFPDTTKSYTFIWFDSTENKTVREITKFKQFKDTLFQRIHNHNYLVTIRKEDGCYTLTSQFWLNAYKDYDSTIYVNQCKGTYFKHSNVLYTQDTIICDTFYTALGCDSLVRYKIHFKNQSNFNQKVNLCYGDTLYVGLKPHFKTGVYFDTLINLEGCDSLVKSDVHVFRDSTYQFIKHCNGNPLNYNGKIYSETGNYIDSLKNIFDCDSIIHTKFILDKDTFSKHSYKICRGDSIVVGKNIYLKSGLFRDTFKRYSTCDSVIESTILVVNDTFVQHFHSICSGDSVKVGTHVYYQSDNYWDTLMRNNGCDSVVQSLIKVNIKHDSTFHFNLCNHDSLFIGGKFYSNDTIFELKFKNIFGCDSTIHVSISKHRVFADFDIDTTQSPMMDFKNKSLGNVKFLWDFGDNFFDSINKDPSHTYNNDEPHYVKICLTIVDSFGCNDTICQSIEISKLVYWLFNSFSPGSDGYNDLFKIGHRNGSFNYNLMIYNRWGALVYQTQNANIKDESKFWNGKVMNTGADCPAGSYFVLYQLYLNGTNKPPKEIHGVITLIRD